MMLVTVGFTIAAFLVIKERQQLLYLVPFTMVPIMLLIFLDSRTAFFAHIVTTLMSSVVSTFPLEFIFMQFIAGVTAINSIKDLSRRSQLVKTALLVFVAYSAAYVAMEVMQTGSVDRLSTKMFGYFAINAVLISFAYILVFLMEKLFGFTSRVTLVELSDTNNALLRELSEECPGTFQHSMSVSNLAAARRRASEPTSCWYAPERSITTSARLKIRHSTPRTSTASIPTTPLTRSRARASSPATSRRA